MDWILGIIAGLLLDIVLILTGNSWAIGWVFAAGIVYVVCFVVRHAKQDSRARRAGTSALEQEMLAGSRRVNGRKA